MTAKAAVFDADAGDIVGRGQELTGWSPRESGHAALCMAMDEAGVHLSALQKIVGTGYGRVALPFADETVTEITCHARGAHFLKPTVRTVIDIGGQDSKVIWVGEDGRPQDFAMNDRCAAGTGKFLQVMAMTLGLELSDLGRLALRSKSPATISSVCTVFAESEVVGLVAAGVSREDIAAGLCLSVARRTAALLGQVGIHEDVLLAGGVAYNQGVLAALREETRTDIIQADEPQLVGAVGAAIIAAERVSARE